MKFRYLGSTIAATLLSAVAWAGSSESVPVQIDNDARLALGDMMTARFSENPSELIGCGVRYIDVGGGASFAFGFCQARVGEAEGETVTCFTVSPFLLDAIHSISSFSFVSFSWDEDFNCTRIGNSTQSLYIPKKLKD